MCVQEYNMMGRDRDDNKHMGSSGAHMCTATLEEGMH